MKAALADNIIVVGAKPAHASPAFPVSVNGTIAVSMPNDATGSLSAPGRRVLSTRPNSSYDFYDGSSFSTAHIAGLAAVIRELSPTLTPAELLELLEDTSDSVTGAINACRAVQVLTGKLGSTRAYDRCS